ncbi:glycosyltransferase family 2 protein [Helicobacter sp.]|uniref:glycosyltransferase family 2 protein n=1 Tax=Helicobacter sp. TaxID=218 RepID=UPI0019A31948|nr:glycosyltransferase family 2 protein [Helicobacter sp.]MBD5164217.1 glycosyltransferase family 2 protein [Helicobacter sp.]
MNPKVSIIVPVYNCGSGNTIKELVQDIMYQTEQSWELLLCNDGSTDNTLEICESIQRLDSRIVIIDNPHRGVSATRNSGIENAKGEWLTFVDCDDHLTGCFLESMLNAAKRSKDPVDLICCSYAILNNSNSQLNLYADRSYFGKQEISKLFQSSNFLQRCSPWARLLSNRIIRDYNLKFDEQLSHSEDRLFVYNYLAYVNSIVTSSSIGYIYESFSANSLKHKVHPFEMLLLRQQKLSMGALAIIKEFGIEMQYSYQFVNNLFNLLVDAAISINRQYHNRLEASKLQKQLVDTVMSIPDVTGDKRILNKINRDKKLSWLISENYDKFNKFQKKEDYLLKIKLLLKNTISSKDYIPNYKDYIKRFN